MDWIRGAWEQAPAVTRTVVALPLAFHALGLVWGPYLQIALELSLVGVKRGYVSGILLSCLWQPPGGLLSTAFTLLLAYMVLTSLPGLERANGSGKLVMWMTTSTVAINLCFLLFAFVLDSLWRMAGWMSVWPVVPCHGLVVLMAFAITLRSLANPEVETTFFGIIPMRNKYYPLALIGFFSLMAGQAVLGDVAAVAMGYAHERLGLWSVLPSDHLLTRWESARCTLIFGRKLFGGRWVTVRESFGGTGLDGGGEVLPTAGGARAGYTVIGRPSGAAAQPQEAGTQFAMFSGRGNRLGS